MKKIYETLEFNSIRHLISEYCYSELARAQVLSITPIKEYEILHQEQQYLSQAMQVLNHYGRLPMGQFSNIEKLLQKADKDGTLFGEDFITIAWQLQNVKEITNYFKENEVAKNDLTALIEELYFLENVDQQIRKCIDSSGQVVDGASSELRRIRRSLLAVEANIRTKISEIKTQNKDMLSQETVSSRNDHLVLPVKASHRSHVKGIVHALSASGQTMFVEPEAIVQMNNQLVTLQEEERREVQRILFSLSQLVKENMDILKNNQDLLVKIDAIFAKANYGNKIDGQLATIEPEGHRVVLMQARHPLIDPSRVVSNDIVIDQEKTMLLISGSNTGGKTVVLKTVGLLSIMALSGLAIPVDMGILPMFDEIYVDLGDEQSIEQSLSTFSSHMKRLVTITQEVTSKSLVLLDEIGSGTDPREGESIAEAILRYLHRKDALTVASTHYSGLKQFAKKEAYIIVSAVEFDQENMQPTYRLIEGSVGNSYAIEISSRLGLQKEIVEEAYRIKEANLTESDKLLEKLQDELTRVQKEKDDLEALTIETKHQLEKYTKKLETLERQKEALLQKAKEEANELLEEAKGQVDEIVNVLKQQQEIKPHEAIDAKYTLDTLKHQQKVETVVSTSQDHVYQLGDKVKVLSVNRVGDVSSINKKGILTVDLGGIKMNVKPQTVEFISKKEKKKPVKSNIRSLKKATSQSYEINVIGKRYEEAMQLVDKFLDDALVHNYSMVRIVHGMGTGALRNGIRKMLDKNKNVVSYRDGGPNEGGFGATLVYFE